MLFTIKNVVKIKIVLKNHDNTLTLRREILTRILKRNMLRANKLQIHQSDFLLKIVFRGPPRRPLSTSGVLFSQSYQENV